MNISKSKSKNTELEALKIWCEELINHVVEKEPSASFLNRFNVAVNKCYEKGDIKSLRTIRRELNEWLNDMSQSERAELEHMLTEKSGLGVKNKSAINSELISIGEISNDDEFRMLGEYIDELVNEDNEENSVTIKKINLMMQNYEKLKIEKQTNVLE